MCDRIDKESDKYVESRNLLINDNCLNENNILEQCFNKSKDWRKCQNEMISLNKCKNSVISNSQKLKLR